MSYFILQRYEFICKYANQIDVLAYFIDKAKTNLTAPDRARRKVFIPMKNTSRGAWGHGNECPQKIAAAVPPPEGVWGAGRSAPH